MTEVTTAVPVVALNAEDHTQTPIDALAGAHEPEIANKEADTNVSEEPNEDAPGGDDELATKKKLEENESRAHITTDKGEDAVDEPAPEDATELKKVEDDVTSDTLEAEPTATPKFTEEATSPEDAMPTEQEHDVEKPVEETVVEVPEAKPESEEPTPAPEHEFNEKVTPAEESEAKHDEVAAEEPVKMEESANEKPSEEEADQVEEPATVEGSTKEEVPIEDAPTEEDAPAPTEETSEVNEHVSEPSPTAEAEAIESAQEALNEEPAVSGETVDADHSETVDESLEDEPTKIEAPFTEDPFKDEELAVEQVTEEQVQADELPKGEVPAEEVHAVEDVPTPAENVDEEPVVKQVTEEQAQVNEPAEEEVPAEDIPAPAENVEEEPVVEQATEEQVQTDELPKEEVPAEEMHVVEDVPPPAENVDEEPVVQAIEEEAQADELPKEEVPAEEMHAVEDAPSSTENIDEEPVVEQATEEQAQANEPAEEEQHVEELPAIQTEEAYSADEPVHEAQGEEPISTEAEHHTIVEETAQNQEPVNEESAEAEKPTDAEEHLEESAAEQLIGEPTQDEEPIKAEPASEDVPALTDETLEDEEAKEPNEKTLDEESGKTLEAATEDQTVGEANAEESEPVVGDLSEQSEEPEEPLKAGEPIVADDPTIVESVALEDHVEVEPLAAHEEPISELLPVTGANLEESEPVEATEASKDVEEAALNEKAISTQKSAIDPIQDDISAPPAETVEAVPEVTLDSGKELTDNEAGGIAEEAEAVDVLTIESQATHETITDDNDEVQPDASVMNESNAADEQIPIVEDAVEEIIGTTTKVEVPKAADASDHADLDPIEVVAPTESTAQDPIFTQKEAFNIDSKVNANTDSLEEQPSESIIPADEAQEIVVPAEEHVPDVQVVMPTPSTEMLSFTSEEDEQESNIPLGQRLAEAAGISAGEITSSEALASEEEVVTPTEVKDEEIHADEETDVLGSQTPPSILLSEQDETDNKLEELSADTSGLTIDTNVAEIPERPKSPWTPSYSVTTQGSAPIYGEETEGEFVAKEPIDANAEKATSDAIVEKEDEVEPTLNEPSAIVEEQPSDNVLITPAQEDFELADAVVTPAEFEPVPSADVAAESIGGEDPAASLEDQVEHAPISEDQERGFSVPDEATFEHKEVDTVVHSTPANLSVDIAAADNLERPKSPWTPSYSVTSQGPGIVEPEIESDIEDDMGSKVDIPETPDDDQYDDEQNIAVSSSQVNEVDVAVARIEPEVARPKSPYPPSYSVHQMGPGMQEAKETVLNGELKEDDAPKSPATPFEEPMLASPASESVADSNPSSNDPEVPSSPRSDLGILTPGFDSRSEVSDASHEPIAPSSPRTDPEISSISEDIKTPLIVSSEEPNATISPLQTPLLASKGNLVEEHDSSNAPENYSDNVAQASDASLSDLETIKGNGDQTGVFYGMPDVPNLASQLNIPELDVTVVPPTLQPVIVTNSLSTDSAYTQLSDVMSPSQETGTNVTTPDVETLAMPKIDMHECSEAGSIEPLDEETIYTSDKRFSSSSLSRTPSGTEGTSKSLGITHTLAMRSFPSAFNEGTDNVSVLEQSKQTPVADTLDTDQLSLPSSRRRLESTTSSLVFPGGWVTSPSQKERPSLDVATGEFSKPIVEGNPLSPEPIPEASEPPSAEKENKWRCIIM